MHFRTPVSAAIAAILFASAVMPAYAGFIDERTPASPVPADVVADVPAAVAVRTGDAPVDPGFVAALPLDLPATGKWAEHARGFGRDESVFDALRAVVPPGYSVSYDLKLPARQVSWHGGPTRAAVVRDVLGQAGYGAHLEGKELVVEAATGPSLASSAPMKMPPPTAPAPATLNAALVPVPPAADAPGGWSASESDGNLRLALQRWATQASWKLVWDYGSDIPLTAGDTTGGSFKDAVRQLLSSTEMMDTPLKPCFYTNSVVRVVPMTVKCDPNE